MDNFNHISVLLNEAIEALNIKNNGIYVDGTAGGGGHSFEIASKLNNSGRLICFDRDPDAIEACTKRLGQFQNITIINDKFSNIQNILQTISIDKIDGLLLDLGVSSYQLDTASRGFSYHSDAPLDMRMSQSGKTAADLVNELSAKELSNILYIYADEKFSFKIANEIVKQREEQPITSTKQLAELVSRCYPNKFKRDGHPARKTFQAIRIAVNDEMGETQKAIEDAFEVLNIGGRLAIITFHSIEDRLVKHLFNDFTKGCTCPPDFPVCVCNKTPKAKLVNRKPIVASESELELNPRSRSAKLRVLEKIK